MRVIPRASRNRVQVAEDGTVKVWITASPTDGQGNLAVCELLAKSLGLPKTAVSIVRGQTARTKQIVAQGLSTDEALFRLRG